MHALFSGSGPICASPIAEEGNWVHYVSRRGRRSGSLNVINAYDGHATCPQFWSCPYLLLLTLNKSDGGGTLHLRQSIVICQMVTWCDTSAQDKIYTHTH